MPWSRTRDSAVCFVDRRGRVLLRWHMVRGGCLTRLPSPAGHLWRRSRVWRPPGPTPTGGCLTVGGLVERVICDRGGPSHRRRKPSRPPHPVHPPRSPEPRKATPPGQPSNALEERRHLPFQVLDASAIEGIRGLVGESSSIYSCIQIYKALTPPWSTPQRIAARRKDLGPHPTWDPPRSDPAQISGRALPRPRPQVRLWGVGRPPGLMAART